MSIRSPLCDITFTKTPETRKKVSTLYQKLDLSENAFFTITQSMTEITIIAPESLLKAIQEHFGEKPKALFTERVGITVRFGKEYLDVPNVLYAIQAALAVHEINFTEIISTYTEFSFILEKKYLEVATQALQKFLK
jgi:aspartokinase